MAQVLSPPGMTRSSMKCFNLFVINYSDRIVLVVPAVATFLVVGVLVEATTAMPVFKKTLLIVLRGVESVGINFVMSLMDVVLIY